MEAAEASLEAAEEGEPFWEAGEDGDSLSNSIKRVLPESVVTLMPSTRFCTQREVGIKRTDGESAELGAERGAVKRNRTRKLSHLLVIVWMLCIQMLAQVVAGVFCPPMAAQTISCSEALCTLRERALDSFLSFFWWWGRGPTP